jgi:hypothetical protein
MAISYLESGWVSTKHNDDWWTGDDSWGCFQVNRFGAMALTRPPATWLVDPINNVQYAIKLYQERGWEPWTNSAIKLGLLK